MKIKELLDGQKGIIIEGVITSIGEPRTIQGKDGRTKRVATATFSDGETSIELSIWEMQVDLLRPGDVVKLIDVLMKEYQGKKQLTTGNFGRVVRL